MVKNKDKTNAQNIVLSKLSNVIKIVFLIILKRLLLLKYIEIGINHRYEIKIKNNNHILITARMMNIMLS